jgi:hypothetical protein
MIATMCEMDPKGDMPVANGQSGSNRQVIIMAVALQDICDTEMGGGAFSGRQSRSPWSGCRYPCRRCS